MTEWLAPWDFSLTAAGVIILAAAFYGCQSGECPRWQKVCFWTGLFSIYAVLLTRFDFYAGHEFFMGRMQQAVLQHVGPFLMALGLLFWGSVLSPRARRRRWRHGENSQDQES